MAGADKATLHHRRNGFPVHRQQLGSTTSVLASSRLKQDSTNIVTLRGPQGNQGLIETVT